MPNHNLKTSFYSKLVRLKDGWDQKRCSGAPRFLFQTGAIKIRLECYKLIKHLVFLFQTGAIKRFSKTDVYIILNPYSVCQLYFQFFLFLGGFAVDLQSCKFSGRLTAVDTVRV